MMSATQSEPGDSWVDSGSFIPVTEGQFTATFDLDWPSL